MTHRPGELENRVEDPLLKKNIFVGKLDDVINWARKASVWPMTFGLACCAIEMMAAAANKHDIDRFGSGPFRATPRQSDLMIVAGTVTQKMGPRVRRLYDQMADPKYSLAMGACTVGGGPYSKYGYHVMKGVDLVIPVDVHVPGCPPRPEALMEGIFRVKRLAERDSLLEKDRKFRKNPTFDPDEMQHILLADKPGYEPYYHREGKLPI